MKKNLRVVEFYPHLKNIHLYKDPGAVLHHLAKGGAKCTVLSLKNEPLGKGYLPKVKYIQRPFFMHAGLWLLGNSRKTDVLFLFHTHPLNLFYIPLYKLLNWKGVAYVKADMDNTLLNLEKVTPLNIIRRVKIYWNLAVTDIFSIEQKKVLSFLQKKYKRFRKKMIHVPNGYSADVEVKRKKFEKKENIIITVGPVGSSQKGTDIIFKVFERIDLKDWKIIMVGEIVEGFQEEIDNFFSRNPSLKQKIKLLGHVKGRKQILELYNRSKIFFMPSRYESFSLALLEAAYFGNVIIGTPVGGVQELTVGGGASRRFNDVKGLAEEITKRINNQKLLKKESESTRKLCEKEFLWERIVPRLHERLSQS